MKALFVLAALAATAAADPATRDYTVRAGDTCYKIVERELGDRDQLDAYHAVNPQLGKTPHDLVPGQIVKLPIAPPTVDANLSSSRGAVRVRKPEVESWTAAERGMDLFRAWRVSSQTRSSAEITFAQDRSRLAMRENTIVIIFGATVARAKVMRSEAVLETGGLESRLDAATKRTVVVRTPSSESQVGAGHALVTVDPVGTSIVANHGGAAIAVRGVDKARVARGAPVSVATGMGSKVVVERPPQPPRKLPAAPAWIAGPRRFVDPAGRGATIAIRWDAVPVAARYRVELVASDGTELTAFEVPATTTALEAHGVPPGDYLARVSTIDGEGFESLRSVDAAFDVIAIAVFAPGATTPLPPALPLAADADLTQPAAPVVVARGSRLVAPAGVRCNQGAALAAEVMLDGTGPTAIQCISEDGRGILAFPIELAPVDVRRAGAQAAISRTSPAHVALELASAAPLGDALLLRASPAIEVLDHRVTGAGIEATIRATGHGDRGTLTVAVGDLVLGTIDIAIAPEVIAVAPPRAPAHHLDLEVAVLAGFHGFNGDNQLGTTKGAGLPSQADAALLALRVGGTYDDRFGLEAELGLVPTTPRHETYRVTDLTYRVHVLAQWPRGRLVPFALIGFGAFSVVASDDAAVTGVPARDIAHDTDSLFYGGLGAKYRGGPTWGVRFDARLLLPPSSRADRAFTTDGEAMLSAYVEVGGHRW